MVNYIFEKFITIASRLPYSRSLEDEADEVGLMLAAKVYQISLEKERQKISFQILFALQACYDIRESINFWQAIHKSEVIPEFISTHPSSAKRAEKLTEKLPWALDIRLQCNCPPLPQNKILHVVRFSENSRKKVSILDI